jgi:hypothetical protein
VLGAIISINQISKLKNMEEQLRIQKMNDLLSRIDHLISRKNILERALYLSKDNYLQKNDEEIKNGIIKMQNNILGIEKELKPLHDKLKELKCAYHVEYKGKLYNPLSDSFYLETQNEIFYLTTCCEIDSFINGWNHYIDKPIVGRMLSELGNLIYKMRFSEFEIINVKNKEE